MGNDDETAETEESTPKVDSLTALSQSKAAKAPAKPKGPKSVTLEFTMTDVEWGVVRQRVGSSGMPAIDRFQREVLDAIS